MTINDLIQICEDEGAAPVKLQLVIAIGGVLFNLESSDTQDVVNPNHFHMCVVPFNHNSEEDCNDDNA